MLFRGTPCTVANLYHNHFNITLFTLSFIYEGSSFLKTNSLCVRLFLIFLIGKIDNPSLVTLHPFYTSTLFPVLLYYSLYNSLTTVLFPVLYMHCILNTVIYTLYCKLHYINKIIHCTICTILYTLYYILSKFILYYKLY